MTTALPELFAQVPTLNAVGSPAIFAVVDSTITGRWDVSNPTFEQWQAADLLDERYVVSVTFVARIGKYTLAEAGGTGFPFEAGGIFAKAKQLWGVDDEHTLEHSRIRDPLVDFLAEHGFTRKRGILR
ncbi:MAG: hypothetical protein Q8M65_08765 [Rhodoglobus sp.]|nr:hypothetical protein [Rhodoglobus sp.]